MESITENTEPKKSSRAKKSATVKSSPKKSPKNLAARKSPAVKAKKSVSASGPKGFVLEASSFLASRSRGQKAAIVAGAVGLVTLLANRRGRGLLKTLGGLALPIAASMAQDKIVERASSAI
jgi:hypothetical protein